MLFQKPDTKPFKSMTIELQKISFLEEAEKDRALGWVWPGAKQAMGTSRYVPYLLLEGWYSPE